MIFPITLHVCVYVCVRIKHFISNITISIFAIFTTIYFPDFKYPPLEVLLMAEKCSCRFPLYRELKTELLGPLYFADNSWPSEA